MTSSPLARVPAPAGGLLAQLPPPPAGKTGWPWTEQSPPLPPDALPLTVVTPTLNQLATLEETIRSVLLQNHPALTYVVLDGASTDGALDILERYRPFLSKVHSAQDKGQSDAINQGLALAKDPFCAWLNGDDVYLPGAFAAVNRTLQHVEGDVNLVVGRCLIGSTVADATVHQAQSLDLAHVLRHWNGDFIPQPATFFRTRAFQDAGGLNAGLHYCMDYELWLELLSRGRALQVEETLAFFRLVAGTKTTSAFLEMVDENAAVSRRFWGHVFPRREYPKLREERAQATARMFMIQAAHDKDATRLQRLKKWGRAFGNAPELARHKVVYSTLVRVLTGR